MPELRALLEAYGADYQATMGRFMGNEGMYLKCLDMLFRDDNLQKLGDALDAGDLDGAFAAAHTLKGVAGNMGLTPYYRAVCAIVELLRTRQPREDYGRIYGEIREEYGRVCALHRQIQAAQSPTGPRA